MTVAPPATTGTPVLELQQVTKQYGDEKVVADVDLSVDRGERLALIGPSGSGKSTLMRLMVGQAVPTSGTVLVDGSTPDQMGINQQSIVGYVPQHFMLYPSLTVQQNARFAAGIYGLGFFERRRRIRETLEHLGLWAARSRPVRNISGGMQRRLAFACALLHRPTLLFVDEPTAGLDPILRETIWTDLTDLQNDGVTVVMNTQYLDEAEKSDRVGLMNHGRLIALGTPDELRRKAIGGEALDVSAQPFTQEHSRALLALPGVAGVQRTDWTSARVFVTDAAATRPLIETALRENGATVQSIERYEPTFDEVFRTLVEEGSESDEVTD